MSKIRLLEAVRRQDLRTVRSLVDQKPPLLAVTDRAGRNLLQLACGVSCAGSRARQAKSVGMVAFLLDRGMGIDVPYGRDACTPLFEAVARGRNPRLVRLLSSRVPRLTSPIATASPRASGPRESGTRGS